MNLPNGHLAALAFALITSYSFAQKDVTKNDTLTTQILPELTLVGRGSKSDIHQLPQIVGTSIYAGKKKFAGGDGRVIIRQGVKAGDELPDLFGGIWQFG